MKTKFEWNPEIQNIQNDTPANSANPANLSDLIRDMQCEPYANHCESVDTQSTNQNRFADIRNRFANNNHNNINEVRNIRKIRNPDNSDEKSFQCAGDATLNSDDLIPRSEAVKAISAVMKRLSAIWPHDLEPDFEMQDIVDFAAMSGSRDEFLRVIQEWESNEISRARAWK